MASDTTPGADGSSELGEFLRARRADLAPETAGLDVIGNRLNHASLGTRTYTHPLTGPHTLDWQVLRLSDDDQTLTIMTAPDAESLEALHRLGSAEAR
jgi:hypothetical protein